MPSGVITDRQALSRAMPVTIPGSAIGSTMSRDTVTRPKNRNPCTANASIVPRPRAVAVAAWPAATDVSSAGRAPVLAHAAGHGRVVGSWGGPPDVRWRLDELASTRAIGR